MYIPAHYRNENLEEVKAFLRQNAFGILINIVDHRPWGTHIPLELEKDREGRDILVGHISRANPQWKSFGEDREVLCIFNGPHAYVSSSWYREEEVPTWNYIAVHVYGRLSLLDRGATMDSLHRLVDKYERDSACPISLNDMTPETLAQVNGVVGFQILVTDIQATYKLSQTRQGDLPEIVAQLEKRKDPGSREIAKQMGGKQVS